MDRNGQCLCATPYTGSDCEQCVSGFMSEQKPLWDSKDNKMHTLCSFEGTELTRLTCNNHGDPKRNFVAEAH